MANLASARNTRERPALDFSYPVAAATTIYAGSIATLTATGYARGGKQGGTRAVGVAQNNVDNSAGVDGAKTVNVKRGCFQFLNFVTDLVTVADIGNDCYVVDDETVARTNGGATRVIAGKIAAIELMGATSTVWVQF
ncbi:hypothetical protein ACT2FY_42810 [Paraburkholderia fungorum]|uniref:hypothetical protein n=1 Tax=Paraburkholderia fungorum TaxID=134537 RepID=UPI00402B5608